MELARALDKDRSSIQRALQNLNDLNVIDRKSMSLKDYVQQKGVDESNKRGYLYVYGAKDLQVIKKEFRELLNRWYRKMTDYIDNLDSLFDCYQEDGELC
jgi:predicted transcriptional regulator